MSFILVRTSPSRAYVAEPGSERSYTKDRAKARRFATRDAAEADRCVGNEVVEPSTPSFTG